MANFVSPSGTPNPNMKIEKEIKKEISDQLSTEVHLPILILPTTNDEIETEMTKKIKKEIYDEFSPEEEDTFEIVQYIPVSKS